MHAEDLQGVGFNCGPQGDGCGGTVKCGSCSGGETCGGGGKPGVCGSSDGGPCTPNTCASLNVNCGLQSNGCGGTLDCGSCNPPATCGGGGPSLCGVPDSGTCTPLTCTGLGFNCGPAGDGCGNTLECGTCSGSQTCGGGGVAGVCGSPSRTPVTCAAQGFNCGPTGDGCGNILDCGTCTAPQVCGGGGAPNVCGSIPCVPTTCAALGLTCGPASDGCGNELQCGTCTAPQACGGGGTPGVCGCTGTCAAVPICPTGMTTTITGNVYDPADLHPLYNVVVYIPNDTSDPALTSPFSAGIACDQCGGATAAGDPLVSTSTAVDGSFTLSNIPVGGGIPLVIQSGRWRREFTVTVTNRCGPNAVSASNTTPSQWLSSGTPAMPSDGHLTMPPNSTLGDIPRIAILSGAFDMVECELRKIGIDDSEFVNPGAWGTGNHVQFYQADMQNNPGDTYYGYPTQWGTGAVINGSTPNQAQLFGSSGGTPNINQYDLVILECEGYEQDQSTAYQNAIATYTNAGGRIFSSDFAYAWLYQNGGFPGVANWDVGQNPSGSQETAYIDMVSNPVGSVFQQWLDQPAVNVPGASAGDFALDPVFHNSNGVAGNTQQWLYWNNGSEQPIHFTFNTPVSTPTNTCGRVTFSDWHTQSGLISRYNPTCSPCWYSGTEYLCCSNYDDWNSYTFPAECEQSGFPAAMTDQETILEFMLFDLTACVPQYQATCVPLNCTEQGISCGPAGDGCGNLIQCGDCTPPATCGGSGVHGVCGTPTCVPATCASQNFNCGEQGDGCGGTLDCGTCTPPQDCGGGGTPGQCGGLACVQKTCAELGIACGPAGDGCGGELQCGNCTPPATCGGGGTPGVCGSGGTCTPTTCSALGINCGPAGDGCGNVIPSCGTCTPPQTCGGGGKAGVCGSPGCTPTTCSALGFNCGPAGDGCGNLLQCGTCTPPATCGGGGKAGVCGTSACTPETCSSLGYNCGEAGDGCGGTISCGTCTAPDTCGGGGQANQCGSQK